MTKVIHVQLI